MAAVFSTAAIADDKAAGIVLIAAGEFVAVAPDNTLRPLKRRSEFFPGEILRTGEDSTAQVRFRDGAVVSLRPETEFRIDEYRHEEGDAEARSISTLIKGGFRTITGTIGKEQPEQYQVNMPVATIGVRGTHYEAVFVSELVVAAWQGGIIVANDAGKLRVGAGGDFNFARVAGANSPPAGLLTPPADLRQPEVRTSVQKRRRARPATSSESETGAADEDAASGVQTDDGSDGPETADGETGTETIDIDTIVAETDDSAELDRFDAEIESSGSTSTSSSLLLDDTVSGDSLTTETDTTPDIFDPVIEGDISLLTQAELDSLDRAGLAVISGPHPKPFFIGGPASDGATGSPVLTHNDLDPSNLDFLTAAPSAVLRRGTAPLGAAFPQTHSSYPVTWGVWNGAAGNPVNLQDDPSDPSVVTAIDYPVFWLTAIPVDPVQVGLTGVRIWGSPQMFLGVGNSGQITKFNAYAGVDFSNGDAFGRMFLRTSGNDEWEVFLNGSVNGPVLEFVSVYGAVNNVEGIDGHVAAFFTGTSAEAIAGSFSLESLNDTTLHAEGLFLLDDSPDQRLTLAEMAALDRAGIAIISGTGVNINLAGPASDGSTGSPILTDNGYDPDQTFEYAIAPPMDVLRQGTSQQVSPGPLSYDIPSAAVPSGDPDYPVSWGGWDGISSSTDPLELYSDPNSSAPTPVNEYAFWTTFAPTPATAIAARSGVLRYDDLVGIMGNGTDGIVSSSSTMLFDIDFDSGAISGSMDVDAGVNSWLMTFDGRISGPVLNINNVSGDYTGVAGPNDAFGNIEAILTGATGQAAAGGFDFQNNTATSGVEGVFVIQCSAPDSC